MDSSKSEAVGTNKPTSGEELEKMRKERRVHVWGASDPESSSTQEKRSKFESLESTRRKAELKARLDDLANFFRRHDHEPKEEVPKQNWVSERKERKGSESEVESAESCYTSNCECWLVYLPSLDIERRKAADPLGRPGQAPLLWFVSHRNTPKARLLGCFLKDRDTHKKFEEIDMYEWYEDLVISGDDDQGGSDITRIPPPPTSTVLLSLPLFSLTRLIHSTPQIDDDGDVLEPGVYEDVGMSFSLPLYPPPSELIPSQEHPIPDDVYNVALIGSCNGLYCLRSGPVSMEVSVIVWNPTTAVSRQLPPFPCSDPDALSFGFGYDHSSGDYKVVKIHPDTLEVEVFSLYSNSNANSWRIVHAFPQRCNFLRYFCNGAVSVEGCLNWLVSADSRARVASFNLATETFRFLPLPPTYGIRSHSFEISSLWILDGCLLFVTLQGFSPDWRPLWRYRVFDIWIMKEYGVESSWTNAATVMFPQSVVSPYRFIYLSKDVLILEVRLSPSRLFVFNLKENSIVCPHIQGATKRRGGVEPYVQSEVSPYCR